jgi:hypothetical protein
MWYNSPMARVAPEKAIHHRPAISFSDDYSVMERCMLLIEDRRHYVYAHARATTGEIFYIGKGSNGRAYKMAGRGDWHNKVVAKYGVDVHILEKDMTAFEAYTRERQLIIDAREMGLNLVNMNDGGEGGLNPSKEARFKMGKSGRGRIGANHPMYGKSHSDKSRSRIKDATAGKPKSAEHRAKIGAATLGKKHRDESITKMRAAKVGKSLSAEHRAKIAAAGVGRIPSDETRQKIRASRIGKPRSEKTRAKISADKELKRQYCVERNIKKPGKSYCNIDLEQFHQWRKEKGL